MNISDIKKGFIIGLIPFIGSLQHVSAENFQVGISDVAKCLTKTKPGDCIIIKNGIYTNEELKWTGEGSKDKNIIIKAQEPGKVIITGASSLRLAGEWINIEGLYFKDGTPKKGSVVEFRRENQVANNCRMSNCVIENFNPIRRDIAYSYVLLYGKNNRIDHNSFTGKLNLGVTLIVMLNENRSLANHHLIDHNYFGMRPVYGSNGAETIRIGTSQQADLSSLTTLENNIFEKCNGEVEVVSIKSSDNLIRNNVFIDCEGVLALRHGNRNEVYGNYFFGHGIRNTAGIRVINAGHNIHDNAFVGLAGTRFFSAMALMDGVPNSLPNRYCEVKDVKISNNIFIDCTNIEFGTGKDLERTIAPHDVYFTDNIIINRNSDKAFYFIDEVNGIQFKNNQVQLKNWIPNNGFVLYKKERPYVPEINSFRSGIGANYVTNEYIKKNNILINNATIKVSSEDNLEKIINEAKDGCVIELISPLYKLEHTIYIDKVLTIKGCRTNGQRTIIKYAGNKGENMVTIGNNGDATIEGINFSGELAEGKALANAGISTADEMISSYRLNIIDCEFSDFGEGDFFAIRGTKSTFTPHIEIKRCVFKNLSGDAINFAAERDDKGRYNADEMIIEDCSFYRLLGLPVNIYRGGSDESTAGPYVEIRNCNFEDCCNKERGSVLRLIGPQVLTVENCNFSNSGRGGVSIRLDEATWEQIAIRNCNFWNSGRVLSMTNKVNKGKWLSIEPSYTNKENHDYTQVKGSVLDIDNIGIRKYK